MAYIAVAHAHAEGSQPSKSSTQLLLMNPPGQPIVEVRTQVPNFDIEKHLKRFRGTSAEGAGASKVRRRTFSLFPGDSRQTSVVEVFLASWP